MGIRETRMARSIARCAWIRLRRTKKHLPLREDHEGQIEDHRFPERTHGMTKESEVSAAVIRNTCTISRES